MDISNTKDVNQNTTVDQNEAGSTDETDLLFSGEQLTNIQLIKKGEEYTESLDLEKAVQLYDEGLKRFPNDTVLMDAYTDLLLQLDQQDKAKDLMERSIQLNPNKEGRKYLNYAEMLSSTESVQMYKKGIEVLKNDAESYKVGGREEDCMLAVR